MEALESSRHQDKQTSKKAIIYLFIFDKSHSLSTFFQKRSQYISFCKGNKVLAEFSQASRSHFLYPAES